MMRFVSIAVLALGAPLAATARTGPATFATAADLKAVGNLALEDGALIAGTSSEELHVDGRQILTRKIWDQEDWFHKKIKWIKSYLAARRKKHGFGGNKGGSHDDDDDDDDDDDSSADAGTGGDKPKGGMDKDMDMDMDDDGMDFGDDDKDMDMGDGDGKDMMDDGNGDGDGDGDGDDDDDDDDMGDNDMGGDISGDKGGDMGGDMGGDDKDDKGDMDDGNGDKDDGDMKPKSKPDPKPAPEPASPSPSPSGKKPAGGSKDANGKWIVCLPAGVDKKRFGGDFKFAGKPDGIVVHADGKCQLEEYAGGFDGFWSVNAGDSHEVELAEATMSMLRTGVPKASEFLQDMMDKAKPRDLEHPRDEKLADNGARMDNINKANKVCTDMITVQTC